MERISEICNFDPGIFCRIFIGIFFWIMILDRITDLIRESERANIVPGFIYVGEKEYRELIAEILGVPMKINGMKSGAHLFKFMGLDIIPVHMDSFLRVGG